MRGQLFCKGWKPPGCGKLVRLVGGDPISNWLLVSVLIISLAISVSDYQLIFGP